MKKIIGIMGLIVGAIEEANKLFKVIDSENVYIAKDYNECTKDGNGRIKGFIVDKQIDTNN